MKLRQFETLLCELAPCLPRERTLQGLNVTSLTSQRHSDLLEAQDLLFASEHFRAGTQRITVAFSLIEYLLAVSAGLFTSVGFKRTQIVFLANLLPVQ